MDKIKDFFLRVYLFFAGPRIREKRYQMTADFRWYRRLQLQTWQGHKMFGPVRSEARQAQKRLARAMGGLSGRQKVKFRKAMKRQMAEIMKAASA